MDFETARKIAGKLENNLKTLLSASEFVKETHSREFKNDRYSTRGIVSTLQQSLILYIECEGVKTNLDEFVLKLETIVRERPSDKPGVIGGSLISAVNRPFHYGEEKYLVYNSKADGIFKEIDAQINILCSEYKIQNIENSSGKYLPSEEWSYKNIEQALNVVNAVKSLTD